MDSEQKVGERFRARGAISVLAALSFMASTFTGILIFFLPPGRIANDPSYRLLGLAKLQWQTLHVTFSLLFLTAALIHIILNWRPLISYFKSRPLRRFKFNSEWVLPLALAAVVAWGATLGVKPFSSLMQYQHNVLPSDRARGAGGPAGSKGFGPRHGQQQSEAPTQADAAPDAGDTRQPASEQSAGRGYGRMTLQELAQSQGIDAQQAVERLRAAGIAASPTDTVRDLASRSSRTPAEIAEIVAKE